MKINNFLKKNTKKINLALLFIIFLVIVSFVCHYCKNKNNKVLENFDTESDFIGNIIYNDTPDEDGLINLPGTFKITGINVRKNSGSSISIGTSKYKLFIGNTVNDLQKNNVIQIVDTRFNHKLELDTEYSNIRMFEDNNTPKYVGQAMKILNENNLNIPIGKKDADGEFVAAFTVTIYGLNPASESMDFLKKKDLESISAKSDNNVKAYKISLGSVSATNTYFLKFKNADGEANEYSIEGPKQLGFELNANHKTIYLPEPIIGNEFIINYKNSDTIIKLGDTEYTVYYLNPSKSEEKVFKLNNILMNNEKTLLIGKEKCPSMSKMMNNQVQIQQICESLEYKDKIRNNKILYQRDKEYLKKLKTQDKEIKELELFIQNLIDKKNKRIENNQYDNMDKLEQEFNKAEEIREEAKKYIAEGEFGKKGINFNINLAPEINDVLNA
tara:strand:+ start:1519 stop:2847 length:1329 start_codon:yes stop_codon:yes gene_type:complete